MSDCYVGEIRMFGGKYAPEGWHLCDGSLLPVRDYQALFSLIGIAYGGDGVNTFALPDLRGRVPVGQGQGPVAGMTNRIVAQAGGSETVTLDVAAIPAHTHTFNTLAAAATTGTLIPDNAPTGTNALTYAQGAGGARSYLNNNAPSPVAAVLDNDSVTASGAYAAQPHQNMMPSFVMNFIMAVNGLYPDRP